MYSSWAKFHIISLKPYMYSVAKKLDELVNTFVSFNLL